MHVQISCEECGRRYKIAESTVRGKRIFTRCKCGARVVVEDPTRAPSSSSTTGSIRRNSRWFVNITTSEPLAMSLESLIRAFGVGRIDTETLVWRRGMVNWAKLRDVKELSARLLGDPLVSDQVPGNQLPSGPLIGESAKQPVDSMPPPGDGQSSPPPAPKPLVPGADADAATVARQARPVKLRLQQKSHTRTGMGATRLPSEDPAPEGKDSEKAPVSSSASEFARMAAELEESGPVTEPLGAANLSRAVEHFNKVRTLDAGGSHDQELPLNMAEPSRSAQTPISMSSSSLRTRSAEDRDPSPLTVTKLRKYALLVALLGAVATIVAVAIIPGPLDVSPENSVASKAVAFRAPEPHEPEAPRSAPAKQPSGTVVKPVVAPVTPPVEPNSEIPHPTIVLAAKKTDPIAAPSSPFALAADSRSASPALSDNAVRPKVTRNPLTAVAAKPAPSPAVTQQAATPRAPTPKSPAPSPVASSAKARPFGQPANVSTPPTRKSPSVAKPATSAAAPKLATQPAAKRQPAAAQGSAEAPKSSPNPSKVGVEKPSDSLPAAVPPAAVRPFQRHVADVQASKAAVSASQCPGQAASGKVQIIVEPWGTVRSVRHLNQAFVGTKTGICVMQAFQQVRVPVFDGEAATLQSSFKITPAR